ncbi:DnaJ domain-containing protein [Aquabacterium sp. OR-4]|uniref:DnaJ domain-containing protein n=1 Tax=Aquabacterium sp. OR-4 TaxID=2978127 RepID=UPI0021B22E00|nr:DnaJ domain-containing protein [Aquabacterium sp. OR-4]MDT7836405.1 DnaJ domain-containing protein [Aquabacterium sp. OR-4]
MHTPIEPPSDPHDVAAGMAPPDNRRNLYRVLHVQPEAPQAVIQASYRTLMQRLRMHPDLGGSHGEAALVNAAWAVLGDPDRRAEYDRSLGRQMAAARGQTTLAAEAAVGGRPCPLCSLAGSVQPRPDSRCSRCHAPLAALPVPGSQAHELLGRRGAVRRDRHHVASLQVGWPGQPVAVRWRDLSLTGLSLYTPAALAVGQRVHLIDGALEAVAEVVESHRAQGPWHLMHGRLISAMLLQATGVFVSAQA